MVIAGWRTDVACSASSSGVYLQNDMRFAPKRTTANIHLPDRQQVLCLLFVRNHLDLQRNDLWTAIARIV